MPEENEKVYPDFEISRSTFLEHSRRKNLNADRMALSEQ